MMNNDNTLPADVRTRETDRTIALALCREAYRRRNGGCFPDLFATSDASLSALLGLPLRHIRRLRCGLSPLWCRCGQHLQLSLHACEDRRAARHHARRVAAGLREKRRAALTSQAPYPALPEETDWLAAEAEH